MSDTDHSDPGETTEPGALFAAFLNAALQRDVKPLSTDDEGA